ASRILVKAVDPSPTWHVEISVNMRVGIPASSIVLIITKKILGRQVIGWCRNLVCQTIERRTEAQRLVDLMTKNCVQRVACIVWITIGVGSPSHYRKIQKNGRIRVICY